MKKLHFIIFIFSLSSIGIFSFSAPADAGEFNITPVRIGSITLRDVINIGGQFVYGSKTFASSPTLGAGQCPLCHAFHKDDNSKEAPNLFGIVKRSHIRTLEKRYLNEPIKIGEKDPATGFIKGKPEQVDKYYRRPNSTKITGEDYLRESLMCPDCYIVEGYDGIDEQKKCMRSASKEIFDFSPLMVDAIIAWLQYREDMSYRNVTISLKSMHSRPMREYPEEPDPIFTDEDDIDTIVHGLGCPLCHTIPGIEDANGVLAPPLFLKTNGPKRLSNPNYKGSVTNLKEYIEESILRPSAFVVFNENAGESYPDGLMPTNYSQQISIGVLKKLVDFLADTEAPPYNKTETTPYHNIEGLPCHKVEASPCGKVEDPPYYIDTTTPKNK
ncbi:MAG: hypothetical protein ACQ9MH_12375 [Nitrospinales bacterium]